MKKQMFKNATLISYKALKNSLYGTPRYIATFRTDDYELLTGTTATYKKVGYTLLNFATVKADVQYHVTAKGNIIIDEIKESKGVKSRMKLPNGTDIEYGSTFYYKLLSRLVFDCEGYIGNPLNPHFWAGGAKEQIQLMTSLYLHCPKDLRPKWLDYNTILYYKFTI